MNTAEFKRKSWWQRHRKWLISSIFTILGLIAIFNLGMSPTAANITKAYTDTALYKDALAKVRENDSVIAIIGTIEPINKLAILEGSVVYTKDNSSVTSSVRIIGNKGKARMDFKANKLNNYWN